MKKMNNKGFSLVELIIVIAIMAVLVGVLAPQFIKYVENSRVATDESAAAEVLNATKIALAIEDVYNECASGDTVTVADGGKATSSNTGGAMQRELNASVPDTINFTSKTYNGKTYTVTITVDGSTKAVSCAGAFN